MENLPTILYRPPSTPPRPGRRPKSVALPPDVLETARGRVKLVALLVLGAVLLGMVTDVPAEGLRAFYEGPTKPATWIEVVLSLVLLLVAQSKRFKSELILNLGLLYQISLCLLISLVVPWVFASEARLLGWEDQLTILLPQITWVTPIIILFPLVIPSPPRRTLVVAILSALTVPLGLLVLESAGILSVEARAYPRTFFSPAVAAIFAYIASRAIYRLGQEVTRARQMGSYQLETKLGSGGMGEVWRARHRMLARPAAIKLVKPDVLGAADADSRSAMLKRFEREAQTTAGLRSPHTVELFDFGVADDGTFYYVMELLDGLDLDRLVRKFGPLPADRTIHILRQMCHSLAEAHDNDLIHRDIKPANVYLCRYGREVDFVKVLDFGLVRKRNDAGGRDAGLTAEGVAGGTPAFMAPEQILATSPLDARTDIYSVGCVAYWLLTGRPVFEGENAMQVMMEHARTEPDPPSTRAEMAIPSDLDELVISCLAKDPADRPQSADQLAGRLFAGKEREEWSQDRAREWWERHHPSAGRAVG